MVWNGEVVITCVSNKGSTKKVGVGEWGVLLGPSGMTSGMTTRDPTT